MLFTVIHNFMRAPSSMKFHGNPWNQWYHRIWETPSFKKFQWILCSDTQFHEFIPINNIYFQRFSYLLTESSNINKLLEVDQHQMSHFQWQDRSHGITLNSIDFIVTSKLAHSKFHGIPWNSKFIEIEKGEVPWNSMKSFYRITWNH